MRYMNWLMITKTKINWNLKFVILKFKYEYWDNTKSKKNLKKGQGGWNEVLQWQALKHKVDIDIKDSL